jgi:hypothetical protein
MFSKRYNIISGVKPQDGVPDMTVISDIDEFGINQNLHVRYKRDNIYVGHILIKFIYLKNNNFSSKTKLNLRSILV